MLEGFNPNEIKDLDGAREAIFRLLNLAETLKAENDRLRAENQRLRDENNRLKGEQGQPNIKANKKKSQSGSSNYSSEKERRKPKPGGKQSKNDKIKIDREQVLEVEPDMLPEDAEFKDYVDVVVQEIKIKTDNVLFRKEKYYSPSEGKTYTAQLPLGYEGQFGPMVKSWIIVLYFAMNVTEAKVIAFLRTVGIFISSGQVSEIIHSETGRMHTEKAEIYEAGLRSTPWQQTDDTGIRVNGQNWYTHIVCNPFYTAYFTKPRKDRLTVLRILWGDRPLNFCLNEMAFAYWEQCGLSQSRREALTCLPQEQMLNQVEFEALLEEHLPQLGPQQLKWVLEGAAIAAYHNQQEFPIVLLLLCDDAPQFKRITEILALCWVHEGRPYKKLNPAIEYHVQLLDKFLTRFWVFYHQLDAYRLDPTPTERERLVDEFDQLFSTVTGYEYLDERIAKTKAKKEELLPVLDHPEIPLHNNEAELGARQQKPKQNISFGPRTAEGAKIWDTGLTLVATAYKLGVNILDYICDRISRANQMPSLATLIEQQAAESQLGQSFQSKPP
jgi:regulator of replication initiation timing